MKSNPLKLHGGKRYLAQWIYCVLPQAHALRRTILWRRRSLVREARQAGYRSQRSSERHKRPASQLLEMRSQRIQDEGADR